MNTMLPLLLGWLQSYGYPALWVTIFCAAIGLPLPITFVLLAAGAFAALGDFNIVLLAAIAISASVCGDSIGYVLGRQFGSKVFLWLEREHALRFISPALIKRSRLYFQRRGFWAIFLSRFLFSALGSPINLLAGAELYPYRCFLAGDFIGESINALISLGLGLAFGASWEEVGDVLGTVTLFVCALGMTIYLAWQLVRLGGRSRVAHVQRHSVVRPHSSQPGILDIPKQNPDTLPL